MNRICLACDAPYDTQLSEFILSRVGNVRYTHLHLIIGKLRIGHTWLM